MRWAGTLKDTNAWLKEEGGGREREREREREGATYGGNLCARSNSAASTLLASWMRFLAFCASLSAFGSLAGLICVGEGRVATKYVRSFGIFLC